MARMYATTLSRISTTVTRGKRSVGMLSLIGITGALAVGDRQQGVVVAVDCLGPGGGGAAGRHFEDVRRKPAVGQAEIKCRGAGVALELQVSDLCRSHVLGQGIGGRALDQCLV